MRRSTYGATSEFPRPTGRRRRSRLPALLSAGRRTESRRSRPRASCLGERAAWREPCQHRTGARQPSGEASGPASGSARWVGPVGQRVVASFRVQGRQQRTRCQCVIFRRKLQAALPPMIATSSSGQAEQTLARHAVQHARRERTHQQANDPTEEDPRAPPAPTPEREQDHQRQTGNTRYPPPSATPCAATSGPAPGGNQFAPTKIASRHQVTKRVAGRRG